MVRNAFLHTAHQARALVAHREVEANWHQPSALRELTIGALAAHLCRSISTIEACLAVAVTEPTPRLISADEYYAIATGLTRDIHDDLNTAIRQRSADGAVDGYGPMIDYVDASIDAVASALEHEPSTRVVVVFGGSSMLLDEYLVTRLVEVVVHIDDLAASIGVDTPELNDVARACVLGTLFAIARRRHGDINVIRALTRTERSLTPVFPVL